MPICNTTLSYPADLGEILLRSPRLRFDEVRERGSVAVKRYWTFEKYRDISFTINGRTGKVMMKGSWAKFHNEGLHNYTPYTVSDFVTDINTLSDLFAYDFSRGLIHGVEAGVNLNLTSLPQPYFSPKYLLPQFITYKGRLPFVPMKTIRGVGQGVECCLTNYRIKLYDKGTQYHLPELILRLEYDCNQIKELQQMGIRILFDLTKPSKLDLLGKKVQRLLADCVVIEPVDESRLSVAERKLYGQAERPSFWRSLSRRNRAYYLDRFQDIIQTYSQHRLHQTLGELTQREWHELTKNCNIFLSDIVGAVSHQETVSCNIFLPVNWRNCYNALDQIDSSSKSVSTTLIQAADAPNDLKPIQMSPDEKRRCEVTGMLLDEEQPDGSKVVGVTTLRKNPDLVEQLRLRYGHKNCKRDYHSEEYRLAHGPRNEKSNGPNNLRRRVNKAVQNTSLFPAEEVIRLTADQQAVLTYFDGTPYEVKLTEIDKPSLLSVDLSSTNKDCFETQSAQEPGGVKKPAGAW